VAPIAPAIALIGLATACWAISATRMTGMDAGPGGELGAAGWFTATWVLMMVAMMAPVVTPLAVRYQRQRERRAPGPQLAQPGAFPAVGAFVAAYVAVWAAAGLLAFEVVSAARHVLDGAFAWERGGRWAAVAVLGLAALYQLTGGKRRSLERCRQTTGSIGVVAGLRAGLNCLGSSWAMMAALFALGVMSIQWMALVALLIAAERLPRNALPGRLAAAAVFLALALGLTIAPASVPGLTIPGSPAAMKAMARMAPGARMGGTRSRMPRHQEPSMK
jgi:predicted metal-binding membrane protein